MRVLGNGCHSAPRSKAVNGDGRSPVIWPASSPRSVKLPRSRILGTARRFRVAALNRFRGSLVETDSSECSIHGWTVCSALMIPTTSTRFCDYTIVAPSLGPARTSTRILEVASVLRSAQCTSNRAACCRTAMCSNGYSAEGRLQNATGRQRTFCGRRTVIRLASLDQASSYINPARTCLRCHQSAAATRPPAPSWPDSLARK
jgi:hypothetical protein